MNSKPILPSEHFILRMSRCREGMLKHRHEANTIENLRRQFLDRMISSMDNKEAFHLHDEVARFLVHDNETDRQLAHQCMKKAIRKAFEGNKNEHKALGLFVNALANSRYRQDFSITKMIEAIKPVGWTIVKPKRLVEITEQAAA